MYSNYKHLTVSNSSILNSKLRSEEVADQETFKFVVSVRDDSVQLCGGFLIAPNSAVTTGQCISEIYRLRPRCLLVYVNGNYYAIRGLMTHKNYDIHETFAHFKFPEYNYGLIQVRLLIYFSLNFFKNNNKLLKLLN